MNRLEARREREKATREIENDASVGLVADFSAICCEKFLCRENSPSLRFPLQDDFGRAYFIPCPCRRNRQGKLIFTSNRERKASYLYILTVLKRIGNIFPLQFANEQSYPSNRRVCG